MASLLNIPNNLEPQSGAVQPSRANLPSYLADLNDQQLTAVTTSEGYLRVIAGAGTGKTRVLTHRYAYLVQGLGIDPANIACVTFTNKAAAEMRHRIRELIGEGNDTSLIATYDSLAAHILREDIEKLFWPKSFQIIDRDQQKEVLGDIYETLGLKMNAASFEKVIERVGAVKGTPDYVPGLLSRERMQVLPRDPTDQLDHIAEAYLQRQKRDFMLDFDDLLVFAQYLLDTCEDIRQKWQQRLNYIMVDEFQDTSADEMRFVDTLAGYYHNLMVVGDPDQNIYEWRGSDVRILVDFDRTHEPCQTLLLTKNYRSTPQILTCANKLIAHNKLRVPKDLEAMRASDAPVVHLHAASESEETTWVADHIEQAHQRGMAYSSIAILYRASFVSQAIERTLMQRNIPYEVVGGVQFMRRMEIADTVAYLRLIAYGDDLSFKRIINTPRRKMGKARLQYLQRMQAQEAHEAEGAIGAEGIGKAEIRSQTLLETLEEHIGAPELHGSGARAFVELIDHLRDRLGQMGVADFVDLVLTESRYEAYVRELGNMERLDNLAEFKRMARTFEVDAGEAVTLYDFLDAISLGTDGSAARDDAADRVRLMTIHQAKGLEFPLVFLMGLTEGIFPSSRTIEERRGQGLEEERRLCYVAITRARDLLVMTESEGFSAKRYPKIPSRFLFEMGQDSYKRIGEIDPVIAARMVSIASTAADATPLLQDSSSWVGKRIVHPVFGSGVIAAQDEGGTSWRVDFEGLPTPRHLSGDFLGRLISEQESGPDAVSVVVTTD